MKNIFNNKFKDNVGLVTYSIILIYLLFNLGKLFAGVSSVIDMLMPFLIGIGIAFVLNIVMNAYEGKVLKFLDNKKFNKLSKYKRPVAIFATVATIICIVIGLIFFIVPQLIESLSMLKDTIPEYLKRLESFVAPYINNEEMLAGVAATLWDTFLNLWKEILNVMGQIVTSSVSSIVNATVTFTNSVINMLLAFIFSLYMLANKESIIQAIKNIMYVVLGKTVTEKTLKVGRVANYTFSKFISGQCIEAIILGTLCFIGMSILRMPYPLLIGVIIALTALIPILGAYIGTIPSAFIIFLVNPKQAIFFVIFILILQQLENSLIYPKVVGESVGLPAMWVMLAMLVGGKLMGVFGMIVGIPLFATIYKLAGEYIEKRIKNINK